MKIWAFIPARAGSKTIPNKNMARLGGRPLVSWVLQAAIGFKPFEKIIVSTDSAQVASYVRKAQNVSSDHRIEIHERKEEHEDGPVQNAVLDYLKPFNTWPDYICLLQPTNPFVKQWQLEQACTLITHKSGRPATIMTATKVMHNSHWMNQRHITSEKQIVWRFPDDRVGATRKQDKPVSYIFGNFVMTNPLYLESGFFNINSRFLEIPWIDALDIDTMEDLWLANLITDYQRNQESPTLVSTKMLSL
jgi:CMP-N,N'-diacetyllegionaminic acid synthase